jgi:hypothetical protein
MRKRYMHTCHVQRWQLKQVNEDRRDEELTVMATAGKPCTCRRRRKTSSITLSLSLRWLWERECLWLVCVCVRERERERKREICVREWGFEVLKMDAWVYSFYVKIKIWKYYIFVLCTSNRSFHTTKKLTW